MALTRRKTSGRKRIPRIKKPAVSGGTKEGGSAFAFSRLKHNAVIVCEVPHICLLVEWISCAAHGGETGKKTGAGHARHCTRVLKAVAALRADRLGRDAVALRRASKPSTRALILLKDLTAVIAAGDTAEAGTEVF